MTHSCVYASACPKPTSRVLLWQCLYMCIILFYRAEAQRVMCQCELSHILLFCLPPVSTGNKKELRCSLECKYLNSDDYKDLLWTTLSEFPGTHPEMDPRKVSQHNLNNKTYNSTQMLSEPSDNSLKYYNDAKFNFSGPYWQNKYLTYNKPSFL